ncbi:MAG: 3-dehydroquinate synthase [Micavibrio aeruginosavorus]|uniref:3-dehydroquinate synthase n=1 Tax=Micavibrio aeruginosavorus TaxID=349221 RepID=A0A2W5HBR5_9BACT|nr:MAG: 3-dehydroquinate synthase [Micavibrio aeruginosavorus]
MEFDFKKLDVNLSDRSYPIYIGGNILHKADMWWPGTKAQKAFIVTDENTGDLYAERLQIILPIESIIYKVPAGEKSKSFTEYEEILEWMISHGLNRHSLVIALGGGVVGDLAGFVSATAMRGVKFIQIPTTLLSQVDSSVGGKTGINSKQGKNLIGAFYQPQVVVIDTTTLKTLPQREMKAGYAEIVKYGLLGNSRFFEWLESNGARVIAGEDDALIYAIETSCAMKAEIVRQDEFEETGLRALLNLGHTFAHALETYCKYDGRLLHGEAVGIGLVLASRLSARLEYISQEEAERVKAHLMSVDMMSEIKDISGIDATAEKLLELMRKDKKANSAGLVFVLLNKLGRAKLDNDVPEEKILEVLKESIA